MRCSRNPNMCWKSWVFCVAMRCAHLLVMLAPAIAAADPAGGTWLTARSPLEVDELRIVVRCTEENRRAGCVVSETYALHNPTSTDVTTSGAFYGSAGAALKLGEQEIRD